MPTEVRAGLAVHRGSTVAAGLRLAFLEVPWAWLRHAREPPFAGHSAN